LRAIGNEPPKQIIKNAYKKLFSKKIETTNQINRETEYFGIKLNHPFYGKKQVYIGLDWDFSESNMKLHPSLNHNKFHYKYNRFESVKSLSENIPRLDFILIRNNLSSEDKEYCIKQGIVILFDK